MALNPDAVIVATGALFPEPGPFVQTAAPQFRVPVDPAARVLRSEELVAGQHRDLGQSAVVFDDIGHYEAIGCCEMLLEQGLDVTYVTRHSSFAPEIDKTGRAQSALRRFYALGNFRILTGWMLLAIRPDRVELRPIEGMSTECVSADTVVLVTCREPFRELWDELESSDVRVFAVGDAISLRDLLCAIREGHLSARTIDEAGLEPL